MDEIKRVPLKNRTTTPVYQSADGSFTVGQENAAERKAAEKRQLEVANAYNSIREENRVNSLGIWESARTPNSFNVRAQQALDPFMKLKEKENVSFFDIEAIGTPEHMRKKDGIDLFSITELSFGGTQFNGKDFVKDKGSIVSMAVAPGKNEYNRMKQQIEQLKRNPMMAVSQDMHRTLLDLAKYSDSTKFQQITQKGKPAYTSLIGHSRVPVAGSAFTRNTISEIEQGLNNLYTKGTKVEDALSIFQSHVQNTNSKLGGYNIHAYDLPAILSVTKDKNLKNFFNQASKSSLDFYHGYSSTTKDPYNLTGASTRQENIHQALLNKKEIVPGKKGQSPSYLYHLAADDIQANIDIAGYTYNKIREFIKEAKTAPSAYSLSPSSLKTNILEKNQELFSFQSGFFDKDKHKYNLVGTTTGEDGGKLKPRWSNLNTSAPSNENFVIKEFLKDIALPGTDKSGYGVRLDSKDMKGKSLLLMSETEEDLAQQLHGGFLPLDNQVSKELRDLKIKHDASFREYERMFDSNGWKKMNEYYGYLNSAGKTGKDFDWSNHIINKGGTEELAQKFPHMVPRLEAEKQIWGNVAQQLGQSSLDDNQKSVALRQIKNQFDSYGDNKAKVTAPGSKFFTFKFGKEDEMVFNAKNTDQIKNSFRSYVKGGRRGDRIGNPEKSYKVARIDEIMNLVIDNFGFSAEGKRAKEVRELAEGMKNEVFSGNKIETALTSMANIVRDEVEARGSSSFTREVTNQVTSTRSNAIKTLSANLPDVIQDSIQQAQSLTVAKSALKGNGPLKGFVQQQDKYIQQLFAKNFGSKGMNNPGDIEKAGKMASKYEELMSKILNSYSNDFNTQIRFVDGGNPLLLLGDKKAGMNLSENMTYEEILRNPKMAAVELPSFDKDLKVRYGSNRKAALIRSGIDNTGDLYHSTTVTSALNMISNYSTKAKEIAELSDKTGSKDAFIKIRQGLRFQVGRQVDPVPTDANRKLHYDDANMLELKSAIGGEVRSSKWDISGFSEQWYRENQTRHGFRMTADQIAEKAQEKGISFFNAMDQRARGIAESGDLLNFANRRSDLKGSVFGINNRSASRGMVGTANTDARTYMALGNYYSDSVENPHKTVNYRKVDPVYAEAALKKDGRNQSYRTKNSFISTEAYDVLDKAGEIRGLTVQTGYMTDEEIALKLKDSDTVARYKQMIDKADVTPAESRQMKKALDMGMLSTSEGLAFMDHRLMKAFNGKDDVRINMKAENVLFDNSIEKAIEKEAEKQGLGNGLWKEKGITFEKPVNLNIDPLLNDKDHLTLGSYTINNIKNNIVDEKGFRKGDKVSILGFNADDNLNKSLILGRERKTGHGFKAVTESGFRATMTPMLKEVMEDIYGTKGAGVEQILSHLDGKKGATDLPSLIRGYDLQIRQQYDGTAEKKIKGFTSVDEALGSFYKDVEKMGIATENRNGQYVVDSKLGLNNEKLLYRKDSNSTQLSREELSEKWMGRLGLDREVYGDITMAHDVWNRQGGKERGRITSKEIQMLDRSYEGTGIYRPGETSAHANWMRSAVYGDLSSPEVRAQRRVFEDMVNTVGNFEGGWKPKAGDAVIDYTTDGVAALSNQNAQMKDGVMHISKEIFQPIPEKSGHNQVLTVGDYNNTVINAGQAEYLLENGEKGKIQSYLMKNKGSAYLKLPEFAGENQYVPLIDTDSMRLPSDLKYEEKATYLDGVKAHYANIARKTEEYNGLFESDKLSSEDVMDRRRVLAGEIDREVSNLKGTVAASTSSDGMARFMSRRLEMSSQYQFGGVNPALAYQKEDGKWVNNGLAKEGEIYMNQKDVRNLIGDKADNIAKSWGVDTSKIDGSATDYVMKNWNNNDTFSTTIRYPSIDVGTTQALKVKMSEAVGQGQVVGLRGMAERISGDFDGDNLAVFLSHYGIEDDKQRESVLKDISNLHNYDNSKNILQSQEVMGSIEKDFRTNLANVTGLDAGHKDIAGISTQFFSADGLGKELTLGQMHGDDAQEAVRNALRSTGEHESWGISKNGAGDLADLEHETSLLRVGTSTTIGSGDNSRMRMSNAFQSIAQAKYKGFHNAEGSARYTQQNYVRETATVNEFLREFSQKAISAKHAEGSNAADQLSGLYTMLDEINSPSKNLDLDMAAEKLVDRGLFKNKPFLEIGEGEVYQGSSHQFIKNSLALLSDAEESLQEAGYSGFRESSLITGASQGIGFNDFSHMVKTGDHIPGMDSVTEISKIANEHGRSRMLQTQTAFEEKMGRIHERRSKNISGRLDDGNNTGEIMNNRSISEPKIVGNNDMPIHRTIRDSVNDSFGEIVSGAKHAFGGSAGKLAGIAGAGFGALWATNATMKSAPTPEGLQEMAPVSPDVMTSPTARVTPNQSGEYINISIKANAAQSISSNDLAAMVNNEVMAMSNVKMNTNVNVNDNSQNIDSKWVEGAVANAMNKGYAY